MNRVETFCFVVRTNVPIDVMSFVYACRVFLLNRRTIVPGGLPWLCAAKYHGFASHYALLLCYLSVCHAFRSLTDRCSISKRTPRIVRMFVVPVVKPSLSHVVYGSRFVCSSLIHAMIHAFRTHSFVDLIPVNDGFAFWYTYRWTIGGYCLCSLTLFALLSGFRLVRFSFRHSVVRLVHSTFVYVIFLLLFVHSSNYFVLVVQTVVLLFDSTYTLCLAFHPVVVQRLSLYRAEATDGRTSTGNNAMTVVELDFESISLIRAGYRYGDHVRVYVPSVSWLETHAFTIVPHVNRRNCFRLVIRVVGRWTERFYRDRELVKKIYLFGPYRSGNEVAVERLLVDGYNGSLFVMSLNGVSVDASASLCLVCTGTSITHDLALLTFYAHAYERLSVGTCESLVEMDADDQVVVPSKIKLVWLLSTVFELNYAVRHLNAVQSSLERNGWQSVLTYEIFVSRSPSSDDLVVNQRVQSFLVADEIYDYASFPRHDDSSRRSSSFVDTVAFVDDHASSIVRRSVFETVKNFASFHSDKNDVHTGLRVNDWTHILVEDDRRIVVVVLTTGVKAIREQLSRELVVPDSSGKNIVRLYVEDLW